ncbi:MAG: hypothetical protein FD163_679 [Hyphomonadaceae bacterium]|nr:MAG: hypothetical protein FD163_679 [Hyphomonadaceae bacterium]
MAFSKFVRNSIGLFTSASLFSAPFALNAWGQANSSTATWNLDGTRLTTNIVGSTMSGNYVEDNGRVSGALNGNVFEGYWGENSSGRRCTTQKLGTYYWGRTRWEFHATGFRGQWGYCDATPSSDWTGTLTSGTSPFGQGQDSNHASSTVAGLGGHRHIWNTSEGRLSAGVQGSIFSGTYSNDNGRISGTVNSNVVDGYWGEDSSGKRCTTQKLGTFYWGRIRWTFNNTGFSGQYGYCDDQFSGTWNGTLVSTNTSTPTPPPPPPPPPPSGAAGRTSVWNFDGTRLTLTIDGHSVNGIYIEDNGRIFGNLSGNTMNGYWGEDSSARRCDTQRFDTYYWGRTGFVFDGARFSGLWSYCDAEPSTSWNGTLVSGTSPYEQGQGSSDTTSAVAGLGGHSHVWTTSEGRLTAGVQGSIFSGTYSNDNGRISGTVNSNVVDGYWGEDSSGKRCSVQRLGTFYWGRIRWTFNNTGFSGRYGYCDDQFSGTWNGTLVQ